MTRDLERALELRRQGRFADANEILLEILDADPGNDWVRTEACENFLPD